ncbi:MAG: hypothetical protein ACKOSR_01615 [Flavobacteriales bacterium]
MQSKLPPDALLFPAVLLLLLAGIHRTDRYFASGLEAEQVACETGITLESIGFLGNHSWRWTGLQWLSLQ